jgi:hypothetical protein
MFEGLVGEIFALRLAIAVLGFLDAVSVGALPLGFLAAAFLVVVEEEAFEATVFVTFVGFVGAFGFAVAKVVE